MKTLSREGIQRMTNGQGASPGGGGGIQSLAGYATQAWTEENYLSKPYFNQLFTVHTQITTTVVDDQGEPVGDPVINYGTLAPNAMPGTTETTDEETGYVTTVATVITSIEAKFGFWSQSFISALGQGSGGGGGGASALTDLVDVVISNPTDGQVLKYNGTTHKWYNGNDEGLTSLPWSSITGKPTTLGGYGITDAYISSGTIYLGGNSITPLTSFTETDPTVPAWAKAASKPSYSFSELTSHPTTLGGYGITDAYISSGTIYLGGNSITPLTASSNAASATKLQTARTIWGQSFDGTANIDGTLSFAIGYGIQYSGSGMLIYKPTVGTWTGISNTQWGVGTLDAQGVIRTNNNELQHYRSGSGTYDIITTYHHPSRSYPFIANSGYTAKWHRLGNYKTAGEASNFAIMLYTGNGYNALASQNSFARIVVKDGWQETPETAYSVGVTVERFGNFDSSHEIKAVVVATSNTEGALWVYLPWQYANGDYTISGVYNTWAHNSGNTDDTTTEPMSNQRDTGYFDIVYNKTYPQFSNLRLRPGTDNYGSYLYFGDGSSAFLAELSDNHLTYKADSHTFNVSGNEAVQINSSGLRIGGSTGVVLSWDSTNNALKVQKADGTAANFYATGGVSALGQGSGGGGGGATALADLTDVEISGTPSDGQVLKYNGTTHKWYNGTDEGVTSLAWNQITGKPTTLSGYGITDAYTKTEADAKYLTSSSFSAFTASSLNISATIGTTTRTVQAPTIAYLGNNVEAASSDTTPSSKFVGTKFGASSGFYMTGVYPSESSPADIPCSYGNILNILGGGGGQLLAEWCGSYKTGHLYYRSHRDYLATGGWTPWEKIAFISDFSSWALAASKPSYAFSELTSHPTTLSGYGITDAKIVNGTITLGSNSITPLTSFTETDPTVPAWAKAATKPSYAFSELTGSVAFSQLPTMYWADQAVSSSSNNNTSPQFGNLRLRPGSGNYGSYLRFGDGDLAYIAELSDDQLTYRAGSHTFNVSSNEAVQINSSGLRIGGSSGVVLSWDSTNNALKVQKADGTAANLYATGGVSALGLSGGSGGSIGDLRVTGTLNIGSSFASLYCSSNNYLYVDAPRIYFNSTLYMGSNNIRTESGNIYTEEGNIYLGGGRLYLDDSRYIYLDGSTLKFYDGSTAKTIYTY